MRKSRKDGHRTEQNQPEDRMKKERQVRQGKSPGGTGDRSRRERKRRDERRKGGITTENRTVTNHPPGDGRRKER